MQTNAREAMLQNLKDAGCGPDIIARFMACQDAGDTKDSLRVLADHRAVLLDKLHASRYNLDCLDFLIRKLRKE